MDKHKGSPPEKLQDNIDTAVKKIIVPVALTVGLLGNSAEISRPPQTNELLSPSSEITSSEAFAQDISPVELSEDESEDDEDEQKRSYKGKNLAASTAGAGLFTSAAVAEMELSSPGKGILFLILSSGMKFFGIFAILSVLLMGTFKAIYPQRKLREIISGKNIMRIFWASLSVFLMMYICDEVLSQKNIFFELMKNGLFLSVILILWFKIFELKGKFGKVMKDLFWGRKGKYVLTALISFNILMSILHMLYNTAHTSNTFTSLLVFYIICAFSVFGIYELCKGRMVEDDDYEKMTN